MATPSTLSPELTSDVTGSPEAGPSARKHAGWAWAAAGILVTTAFILWPLLESGYLNDDALNSQIPMRRRADGVSFWEHVRVNTQAWIDSVGRFFPSAVAQTAVVFTTLTSRGAYKAYQFAAVVMNVGLFAWLVLRVTSDRWIAGLAALLAATTFQFRFFHDGILAFNGQQQMMLGLVLASLLLAHAAVRSGRLWLAAPTAVLWAVALTTYETAFLLVPAVAIVAWHAGATRRQWLAVGAAALVPAAALGGLALTLRGEAKVDDGIYSTDLSPSRVVPTFFEQAVASVPLSYTALAAPVEPPFVPNRVEPLGRAWDPSPGDLAVGAVIAATFVALLRRARPPDRRGRITLGALALLLWLPPALLMASTPRWQQQLELGTGYITAYMGGFGVALLSALGAVALMQVVTRPGARRAMLTVITALVVLATLMTADNNDRVVHMFAGERELREAFEGAVTHGVLDVVGADERVASPFVKWVNAEYMAWFGGPSAEVVNTDAPIGELGACRNGEAVRACVGDRDIDWVIEHGWPWALAGRGIPPAPGDFGAWVQLTRVAGIADAGGDTGQVLTDEIHLYVSGEQVSNVQAGPSGVGVVVSWAPPVGASDEPVRRSAEASEVRAVGRGSGWLHLVVKPGTGLFYADTVEVRATPANSVS